MFYQVIFPTHKQNFGDDICEICDNCQIQFENVIPVTDVTLRSDSRRELLDKTGKRVNANSSVYTLACAYSGMNT